MTALIYHIFMVNVAKFDNLSLLVEFLINVMRFKMEKLRSIESFLIGGVAQDDKT